MKYEKSITDGISADYTEQQQQKECTIFILIYNHVIHDSQDYLYESWIT